MYGSKDDGYVDDIKSKIPVWLAEGYKDLTDNRKIWDWLKYNVRVHAIQHSKQRAKERIEKEKHQQEKYSKAKTKFERDPNNLNVDILNSAKEDLELFYEEKVKGIIILARAFWREYGEKSTKYFLNLEKKKEIISKNICEISGSITTDPFNILSEQQRFSKGFARV